MKKGKEQSMLRRFRPFSLLFCVFWLFSATSDRKGPGCVAEFCAMWVLNNVRFSKPNKFWLELDDANVIILKINNWYDILQGNSRSQGNSQNDTPKTEFKLYFGKLSRSSDLPLTLRERNLGVRRWYKTLGNGRTDYLSLQFPGCRWLY